MTPSMFRRRLVLASLTAVVLVAALARIAAQIQLGFYDHAESWEQDVVARSLAAGDGFEIPYHGTTYYALVHPIDPFVFAAAYRLFGATPIVAGILLVVIGSGVAAAVCALCRSAGLSVATATLAGLLVATHPGLVVYAAKLHPLELDALVLVLVAIAVHRMDRQPTRPWTALTGVVLGIAVLERVSFVPFAIVGLTLAALRRPIQRPRVVAVASSFVLAALIALPWSVRNVLTIGSPVIVSTSGLQLWLGNNPVASGSALLPSGEPVFEAAPGVRDLVWGRPEVEQDRILREAAIAYIAADPGAALARTGRKLLAFWWASDTTGLIYPRPWKDIYLVYWTAALAAAAAGAYGLVRRNTSRFLVVILLATVSVSLIHAITYVEGRHRWAVESLVLLLAAVGIVEIATALRRVVGAAARSPVLSK